MRLSQYFLPVLKENPAEAQISETTGKRFLQDQAIIPYLAARYGIGLPHP